MTHLLIEIKVVMLAMVAVLLLTFSLTTNAQEHHAAMGAGHGTAQSGQQSYREFIEKPSGYDTPKGGLLTQPWVWTLTAAGLVLLTGFIYKSNSDRDEKSETGVNNQTV